MISCQLAEHPLDMVPPMVSFYLLVWQSLHAPES